MSCAAPKQRLLWSSRLEGVSAHHSWRTATGCGTGSGRVSNRALGPAELQASDISFAGSSESALHAETLLGLISTLDLGPVALAAGSAGSRVALLAASIAPDLPNSRIVDPPWADQEWNNCQAIPNEPGRGRFERWPMLAPVLLEFLKSA